MVRCLALAEELLDRGWHCVIHTAPESIEILNALSTIEISVHVLNSTHADETKQMSEVWPSGVDVMLIDHYERSDTFETQCRSMANYIVSIDDRPSRPHAADILFDPTAGRAAEEYKDYVSPSTKALCGSQYALLRTPFHRARKSTLVARSQRKGVNRVLVTMGMSSMPEILNAVLDGIEEADINAEFDFVCGLSSSGDTDYERRLSSLRHPGKFMNNVSNMEALMIPADISIGAPGSTSWERCCLGLPSILCIIADNQLGNGQELNAVGAAVVLDWRDAQNSSALAQHLISLSNSPFLVREMSQAAAKLCDGKGTLRAADAIESLGIH
jgi:UDP-2,4-diacetamido-2,4,6-trideoxy-beta-L-altropyranose hydrolase